MKFKLETKGDKTERRKKKTNLGPFFSPRMAGMDSEENDSASS
jgi:hypothetical protein